MAENDSRPDQQATGRAFLILVAGACLGVGGQPLVNYYSGDSSLKTGIPALLTVLSGLALLAIAFFWHPQKGFGFRLMQKLSAWGSSPAPYALVLLSVWIYLETLEIQKAAQLRRIENDQLSIANVINRLVLPRRLTEHQQQMITVMLRFYEPCRYVFRLSPDQETGMFAGDIAKALDKGGWKRLEDGAPLSHQNSILQEGVHLTFIPSVEHAHKQYNWKDPDGGLIMQEAFGIAGVRLDGGCIDCQRDPGQEDLLVIEIGPPRRDSYAFTADEFR